MAKTMISILNSSSMELHLPKWRVCCASGVLFGCLAVLLDLSVPAFSQVDYRKEFEWEDTVPSLYAATTLQPKEGVTLLFDRLSHLRIALVLDLQRGCSSRPADPLCRAELGDPLLERAISNEVKKLVELRLTATGSLDSVDYDFSSLGPWPFTSVVALRSRTAAKATLVFDLPANTSRLISTEQSRLGPPQERNVDADGFEWFTYRKSTKEYTLVTRFKVDTRSRVRQVWLDLTRIN